MGLSFLLKLNLAAAILGGRGHRMISNSPGRTMIHTVGCVGLEIGLHFVVEMGCCIYLVCPLNEQIYKQLVLFVILMAHWMMIRTFSRSLSLFEFHLGYGKFVCLFAAKVLKGLYLN